MKSGKKVPSVASEPVETQHNDPATAQASLSQSKSADLGINTTATTPFGQPLNLCFFFFVLTHTHSWQSQTIRQRTITDQPRRQQRRQSIGHQRRFNTAATKSTGPFTVHVESKRSKLKSSNLSFLFLFLFFIIFFFIHFLH